MPVVFIVDQALPAAIHTITLSYTLFDVTATMAQTAEAAKANASTTSKHGTGVASYAVFGIANKT